MTSVIWDPRAGEFLRKLPKDISKRIFNKINIEVKENVERYLEPLVNLNGSKIRVGDYRLFVDYYKNKDLLVIRLIRHRRDAYKNK